MRTFPKSLSAFREIVSQRGQRLRGLPYEELQRLKDAPIEHLTVESRPSTMGIIVEQQAMGYTVVDGSHMKLWCQKQFRDCRVLQPGHYEAESQGDSMVVMGRDPSGKTHRIKYRVVDTW